MSTRVHLYSDLPQYAANRMAVELEGTTVGEILDNLVKHYPDIGPQLLDANGKLLPGIFVSLNLDSTNSEMLSRQIQSGDEIYLIRIVAGG